MVATWLAATAGAAALTTVPLGYNYYTGLALSFPVIWLLYSLAGCQLVLYVCLRLFVRLLEDAVQDPTRRALRRKRDAATSYAAWSALGEALDASQPRRRGGWADDLTDWTAQHFSWDFFGQLIADLRAARETGDVAGAVAALWQCLRKDVGGIFATDLFAHLHTGRPKVSAPPSRRDVPTRPRPPRARAHVVASCAARPRASSDVNSASAIRERKLNL